MAPTTAVEALRDVLQHHSERANTSLRPTKPLRDAKSSSLDLISSNAAFPVVETTTLHWVERKSTEKLFELENKPVLRRAMWSCRWPASETLDRVLRQRAGRSREVGEQ